ncbi:protein ALWAYS EARLY 3-like [Solanum tuberosum]|uniref:protein ALWAYS EARLY 3-like n=1 Tax=Solanum tuberosum TaxID=4113 RepID=UPI00073A4857|nr:PREDICTED: protein ALWAYS EARLY 3-like [Solanum tuberosum]XP_015165280.1 PREDICTED: protein ALWAYS EARLY 3-like [Solanum tuberosum]
MAPAKKSRTANKRFSPTTEISPSKDGNGDNSKKSLQRKRKLSDMLGPKWSDENLTHFYQAYRKYGKDWKKVAGAVKPRTAEMVEALYTMNRAYLSLPEGTASVVGLIAMMTDHYCNLAASDSEQESNEDAGTSRKPQKRARVKTQPNVSKTSEVASPTLAATHGCLTLLKKKRSGGSRPRAVGKRTPRFPVSFSHENPMGEKYFSPSRQSLKLQADDSDTDEDMKIALVLTEASQRGGSPQVSQTPNRWTDSAMSSPAETAGRKRVKMGMGDGKLLSNEVDEEEGSMEADTGELLRYKKDLTETGIISRTAQKGRKPYGEKLEVDSGDNHFDDIKEACSGTEEGQRLDAVGGKLEMEASDEKNSRTSLQGPRKRSKKMFFRRDEDSPFDALQTLADLSLMMPTTENEDESIPAKDDTDDHVDESGSVEALPANKQRDKHGSAWVRSRWSQPVSKSGVASSKTLKHGKVRPTDVSAVPETKQVRRAQKAMSSKARKSEGHINNEVTDSLEAEAKELPNKSTNKGKRANQSMSPKLIKDQEHASCVDPRTERSDSAQSTAQIPVENQVNLPAKVRSRRKMDLKKPQRQRKSKISDKFLDDTSASVTVFQDRAFSLEEKISNRLSKHQVRSWCIYEWFYSAIDYPWFAKREFVEYLYHVGLGHVPRLTRVEWGVIRSSLGKPRRFSEQFLNEEKEKLYQYRESVRTHYNELREGTREGLPTDLAKPLSVGQRVIAIHPKTREIHDGSVLTVDRSRCRVQFDRPELGVEFVMDFECMPRNPFENMPTSLKRHADGVDKFFESFNELKVNVRANEFMKFPVGDNMENGDVFSHFSPPSHPISNLLMQNKVASAEADMQCKSGVMETAAYQQTTHSKLSVAAQILAKEADVQALVEFNRALDKKDAVVSELRRMNDEVLENEKSNDSSLRDSEPFKKQYAAVLIQLNEVNQQVSSALYRLRQRNNHPGNMLLALPRPVTNFIDPSVLSTFDRCTSQPDESGFLVNEIIESSKIKARTMVDAAVQAMNSFSRRENTTEKIEAAIDYVNDRIPLDDSCMPIPPDPKSKNMSDTNEAEIPSELISKCVATLLMIQKCTERQFPPADVAKVLDSAVASLQPSCSQNSPIYREIQKCMGIIRSQILSLVPT